jgi:hypothetical protein
VECSLDALPLMRSGRCNDCENIGSCNNVYYADAVHSPKPRHDCRSNGSNTFSIHLIVNFSNHIGNGCTMCFIEHFKSLRFFMYSELFLYIVHTDTSVACLTL